jgi:hypothetical protein
VALRVGIVTTEQGIQETKAALIAGVGEAFTLRVVFMSGTVAESMIQGPIVTILEILLHRVLRIEGITLPPNLPPSSTQRARYRVPSD